MGALRLGIVSDLHVGGSGLDFWNNYILHEHAVELVVRCIAVLEEHCPDLVVILGDVTTQGERRELALARELLEELDCPWCIIPGNHERPAADYFDTVFNGHSAPTYLRQDEYGLLFLREDPDPTPPLEFALAPPSHQHAVELVAAAPPGFLLIFSHTPLLSQFSFARLNGGRYAGHLADGEALVHELSGHLACQMLICCGHAHWHRVTETPAAVQITTGALVEYPLEMRWVELQGPEISYHTVPVGPEDLRRRSLADAPWTAGEERDRSGSLCLRRLAA